MSEYKDYAQVRIFPPGVPIATILLGYVLNRMIPLDLGFSLPVPGRYWIDNLLTNTTFFNLNI